MFHAENIVKHTQLLFIYLFKIFKIEDSTNLYLLYGGIQYTQFVVEFEMV